MLSEPGHARGDIDIEYTLTGCSSLVLEYWYRRCVFNAQVTWTYAIMVAGRVLRVWHATAARYG